ncbi:unnamed protein product [Cuscuta epithymum]|uniref:Response regulatory domain-containing protein n=1 Tax=Cuscuta epithymum TaxID=186058 RepID=A0AAV0EV28_9ASTE|nr:unnamed protein product [Cuscuta epithymum]
MSEGAKELADEDDRNKVESESEGRRSKIVDDKMKVKSIIGDVNDAALQGQGDLPVQPQRLQSPGGNINWEKFLHISSIKVLLVESDDSTRQIVTALLRKCNYEVIVAANGLQAWKVLEELTNHIDLVLAELEMPCVSGMGLLCKIMSHKTRKNLPVIMMSSRDSMGLVVKCLSKGAVDFLVKPVRKNELKNLWQHVWRRCQSSSGSGSETGTKPQDSVDSKSVEKQENKNGINGGDSNGSGSSNIGNDGAAPQPTSNHEHFEDNHENHNTCASGGNHHYGQNGKTEKGGSGDACGSGFPGHRMDPNKLAKRQAALTRFLQKKRRRRWFTPHG